jgi:ubiquinone/menaquinone biosynthesis C-methylase UbiE
MGRQIAPPMSYSGANWLMRETRAREENPEKLLKALNLKPGQTICDFGCGNGYYTVRLAKRVGPRGAIYAVDIQQEMLDLLTNKMAELNIRNVLPVLGTVTDPKLPNASVDLVFMVDVYHEFDFPYEMVDAMCRSLKSGGRIVFVEFRGEDPKVPIKLVHKMTEAQVRKEMSVHPLQWVETVGILPWQHIIIFQRK